MGVDDTPGNLASIERLMTYWAEGAGAAKIGWGTPGDFFRCTVLIQHAVTDGGKPPLGDAEVKGLCSNLHRRATGFSPGHAPGERPG